MAPLITIYVLSQESLEKARLEARREAHYRYERTVEPITEPAPQALAFMSDADRFHSDTAGEEKKLRDQRLYHREAILDAKRTEFMDRETSRWDEMEKQQDKAVERVAMLQASKKGLKNHTSVAYNPITLEYQDGPGGDKIRNEDDMIRYRAALRAENLEKHQAPGGFNPITGEPRAAPRVPVRPAGVF